MPGEKKIKVPYTKRYENAERVQQAPKKEEGYSAGETLGDKTYYDKSSGEAIPGSPGSMSPNQLKIWKQGLIDRVKGGEDPYKMMDKGYFKDPALLGELSQHYKALYTQPDKPPPVVPSTANPIPKYTAERVVNNQASGKGFTAYNYPSGTGGAQTTRYFASPTGSEDITTHTDEIVPHPKTGQVGEVVNGQFKGNFAPNSNVNRGANLGTVMGVGAVNPNGTSQPLPTDNKGNLVVSSTPTRIQGGTASGLNDPVNQANLSTLVQKGYKKGGLIGKLRGYAAGTTAAGVDAVGVAGQAAGGLSGIIDPLVTDQYGRYNTGSNLGNYGVGFETGALKGVAAGAALGPIGMAVGGGLGAAAGLVKAGMGNKSIRTENNAIDLAKRANIGRMAGNNYQENQNQVLQDRGFKRGGLIGKLRGYAVGGDTTTSNANYNGTGDSLQGNKMFSNGSYLGNMEPTSQKSDFYEGDGGSKGFSLSKGGGAKIGISTPMFNNGGEIDGKGTSKSDSIVAKVKASSFVVPAVNAKDAEVLRKYLLPSSKKKANLNQAGGEKVKLSDGEHLFDPDEKAELERQGVNLKKLAPDADDSNGYDKGGPVDPKKEQARINAEREAIRIKEQAERDKNKSENEAQSRKEDREKSIKGYVSEINRLNDGLSQLNDEYNKSTEGMVGHNPERERVRKEGILNKINELQGALKDNASKYESLRDNKPIKTNRAPSTKTVSQQQSVVQNNETPPVQQKASTSSGGGKLRILSENEYRALSPTDRNAYKSAYMDSKNKGNLIATSSKPSALGNRNSISRRIYADDNATPPTQNESGLSPMDTVTAQKLNSSAMAQEGINQPVVANNKVPSIGRKGITNKQLLSTGTGIVSNLANYILPYKQTQMGLDFLGKAGARPTGQIDPAFQNTVNKANSAAQYGFTPEEEAYVNQQNLSGLRAGQNAARNYSGGSAGNAYNMERDAANQYFGRGLQAKIASRNLQMDKQQQANDLNLTKANMSRQLFNDNLNAWQQSQQAGSSLVSAGLNNAIGAKMYNDEINMEKERSGISNSWLNNI